MDGRDIHPSQVLLLVGWIASRLSWQAVEALAPSEAGGLLFRMSRADGEPIADRRHATSTPDSSGSVEKKRSRT